MYCHRTRPEMFYPTDMTETILIRCHTNETDSQAAVAAKHSMVRSTESRCQVE